MKQALISPAEVINSCYRVAEVSQTPFQVSTPLFWVQCSDQIQADQYLYNPVTLEFVPVPSQAPTAEQNKQTAITLLQQTDWAVLTDVDSPSVEPHLINKSDFINYRASLRQIAVYPVAGYITWPQKPTEQWGSENK